MTPANLRYLLLQIRNPEDPMREQEVGCFVRALLVPRQQIEVVDLLTTAPMARELERYDMVLIGGSGHYSVAGEGTWLERTFDSLREIHALAKPTFASCWGFQAFARALGGRVVHDPLRAELGTHTLRLTDAGLADPLFAPLGPAFAAQMGHEDCVDELPPGATRLASSELVENQAYRFDGLPIYCTQFHPELDAKSLRERAANYPEYIEHITGLTVDGFAALCRDTPESEALLPRFVAHVFGG